jgi:hypothetical protein
MAWQVKVVFGYLSQVWLHLEGLLQLQSPPL